MRSTTPTTWLVLYAGVGSEDLHTGTAAPIPGNGTYEIHLRQYGDSGVLSDVLVGRLASGQVEVSHFETSGERKRFFLALRGGLRPAPSSEGE